MKLLISLKMALKSIFSNKLRTFLTMLGVIIGVASVIAAVGFAKGSTSSITSSIENTGTNQITIMLKGRRTSSIGYDDVAKKLDEFDGIDGYAPIINGSTYIKTLVILVLVLHMWVVIVIMLLLMIKQLVKGVF